MLVGDSFDCYIDLGMIKVTSIPLVKYFKCHFIIKLKLNRILNMCY